MTVDFEVLFLFQRSKKLMFIIYALFLWLVYGKKSPSVKH